MLLSHSRVLWSATWLLVGLALPVRATLDAPPAAGVCDLVTRQEAAAALGAAVPAGTAKNMDLPMVGTTVKMEVCFFGSEVMVARYALGSGAPELFSKYRQSLAAKPAISGYENVPDLGDEAFAAKGQLAIRKGQTGLIVDVGQARGGGPRELKAEKALAALAIGRL
jgi:hypothetical protein